VKRTIAATLGGIAVALMLAACGSSGASHSAVWQGGNAAGRQEADAAVKGGYTPSEIQPGLLCNAIYEDWKSAGAQRPKGLPENPSAADVGQWMQGCHAGVTGALGASG
jgi:hypothetical protein